MSAEPLTPEEEAHFRKAVEQESVHDDWCPSRLEDDTYPCDCRTRTLKRLLATLDAARAQGRAEALDVERVMDVLEDAFRTEAATRGGNGWSDVHGRNFILMRVLAAIKENQP